MKNCLNCSYFTLMLNTVKRGSAGSCLPKEKLNLLHCWRNAPSFLFLNCICHNMHTIYCLPSQFIHQSLLFSVVCSYPNHHVSLTNSCIILSLILCFLTSRSLSALLSLSAPVSRHAANRKDNSFIKVPAWSHQFTLLLTDPCAARYIKKKDHPCVWIPSKQNATIKICVLSGG